MNNITPTEITQRWREACRERGVCIGSRCREPALPGRLRCAACVSEVSNKQKLARHRRLAAGTCAYCDDAPAPGRKSCERHLALKRERGRIERARKRGRM